MATFIAPNPRSMKVNLHEEVDSLLEVIKGLDGFVIFIPCFVSFSLSMDVIHAVGCI